MVPALGVHGVLSVNSALGTIGIHGDLGCQGYPQFLGVHSSLDACLQCSWCLYGDLGVLGVQLGVHSALGE